MSAMPERVWVVEPHGNCGWSATLTPMFYTEADGTAPDGAPLAHTYVPEARALDAEAERDAAYASENAMSDKMDALLANMTPDGQTCGCSFDHPGDICMHHSPEIMRLRADLAALVPLAKLGAWIADTAEEDSTDHESRHAIWTAAILDEVERLDANTDAARAVLDRMQEGA